MDSFDIQTYLQQKKALVDKTLNTLLPDKETFPASLHQAMRYCLFAGGKRLRPILALAAAEAVGGKPDRLIRQACALELLHTYTLIHDDLPAMDNDDYRRGCLATHKVFGEAIAVLTGDALLTEAFKVLADHRQGSPPEPAQTLAIIKLIAEAGGSQGVIGGQVVDLESEGKTIGKDLLEYIHIHKTGKLITASVMLGALLGRAREKEIDCLEKYAKAVGLAFQITDDILDMLGSTKKLGKKVGSDTKKGKATYPGILGMDAAKKMQQTLFNQAIQALQSFGEEAEPLRAIAKIIIERDK